MTIFKYSLDRSSSEPEQELSLPLGARILCVQIQDSVLCLWALVKQHAHAEIRTFVICDTGEEIDSRNLKYIGTYQFTGSVGHVFEKIVK